MALPAKKSRVKAPAHTEQPPQNREDCAVWVKDLGDLQRRLVCVEAQMNDEIAVVTGAHQPVIDELKARIKAKQAGIQTYAEANREALTEGHKTKTVNLVTGLLLWRARPPSCKVTGEEAVIAVLKTLGLGKFVRTKEEVNKEAILNEPAAVANVPGIKLVSGVEDFIVQPFEQEAV